MIIHPLAIVSPEAEIGKDVTIGPFAVIESDVVIEEGCRIAAHAVIKEGTTLGPNNEVGEAAILGGHPQHLKKPEQLGRLVIGAHNIIREHATLHRSMKPGEATIVGDRNLLMAGAHVAHDCRVGNRVVLANNALLAGHVIVEDSAFLSGAVGVHQFCRIGALAMIGGLARVVQDVPPYVLIDGISGCVVGLNLVGLRRNGYTTEQVAELKRAYRMIYRRGTKWSEILEALKNEFAEGPATAFHQFLSSGKRGFVQERRLPPGATIKLRSQAEEKSDESQFTTAPELWTKAG
ncbi:MAG: acyl-ACP--UDP-N-acetylglucosamine O-acyltransferase [Pirellulales bacterium]